jgi:cellulose synthase/poly-beta-1,6-N-acetylglucosamine synthase-like glycosyltransferase
MIPSVLVSVYLVFWDGFIHWLSSLTPWTFLLFFWPLITIDFLRSAGKSLFLVMYSIYRKLKSKTNFSASFMPKITLIIPAHNEEKIIIKSIESALEADYPNKEIIVVDDGSKDKTYQLASFFAEKGQIKLIHRDVSSGSKAGALNYGLFFASGEIVVTVDADTLIERNSLKQLITSFSDPNVSAASGNVRILSGEKGSENLLVKLQAYEYLLAFELGRRFNSVMGTLLIISGAFGVFRKNLVKTLGEYDKDTLTEDFDITIKFRKLGKKLLFVDKAVSWTFAPETLRDWRRQRIRWTRGQAETLWKHRNLFLKRGFDFRLVLAVYDMLFADVIVLFLRFIWLFSLIFFFPANLPYIIFFSFVLYLLIEFFTVVFAGILSPKKSDLKNVVYVPIMVLFYRPYYSIVRLRAYFDWILKRKSKW